MDLIVGTFAYREPKYVHPQKVMYVNVATCGLREFPVTPNNPPDGEGSFGGDIDVGVYRFYCLNYYYSPPIYRYLGQLQVVAGPNLHTVEP